MIRRTACIVARRNDPCRNLAIEKHLMDTLPERTAILYLSQNDHSIIIGRNQNPWYECKVESFLESNGTITRRLSGGAASYQDMGCLNYSFIVPKADFDIAGQLSMVCSAAAAYRLRGETGPRGNLYAQGLRFCQNAFYKSGSAAIQHGTLLVDASMDAMEHYQKSKHQKARAAEELPVRSRVINLRELDGSVTMEGLQQALCRAFAAHFRAEPIWLDEQMMDEGTLSKLTARFAAPEWVYPEAREYNFTVDERFPWGSVSVLLWRENGIIRAARLFSDAMESALFSLIEQGLLGCPFLIGAITKRFEQKLALLKDVRLLQIAGDVCTLICGRMRAMDRNGGAE